MEGKSRGVVSAGTLATGGNLVFQGTPDGQLVAYRADNGQRVWSWQGYEGIIAGAMTYTVRARIHRRAGRFRRLERAARAYFKNPKVSTNGRVLVFKLDGKAVAPDNSSPSAMPSWRRTTSPKSKSRKAHHCMAIVCSATVSA